MTTTAYYWAVIYTAPGSSDPMISLPIRAISEREAHDRVASAKFNRTVVNVAGPFGTPAETDNYRLAWMRERRATSAAGNSADSDVFDLLDRSGVDLDDPKWSGMDAFDVAEALSLNVEDPADSEVIETGPGFPVACASMHEHDPIACAPEPLISNADNTETVWSVTAESFDGTDTPMPAETFISISNMDALIKAHRAAGTSVEVSWPFGSDGTESPTYVHVYADGRGVTTFRRANPGESGTESATETDDTAVFLERQNRALEAFRSRIAQEITITLQRIEGRGPDAKISASEVGRWLTELRTLANREHDRQMRL